MKTFRYMIAAVAAIGLMAVPANATTFVFKGAGNNVTPVGAPITDYEEDCASTGDFCSVDHSAGLSYEKDGYELQVRAYAGGAVNDDEVEDLGDFTRLIQDINPSDSGLGAWSENNGSDDQTQFDAGESIEFIFDRMVQVTNVEFNAGGDTDCTNTAGGGGEGPCGAFILQIFDDVNALVLSTVIDVTNINELGVLGTGMRFVLTAVTQGGGFTIAQLTVNEVPVPAALPLLLSGLAGLGFASRRRKNAA